ncbi:MFS transporter [Adlercreutzia sp. R25]|uniref:MFS transporter n=1 Tax=Adlercreutzia shanghongiae TaxID=3111773 RepID=UPI002DB84118|nr:MFS transporter [Adlercreutzia sp. R25]MEC4272102.1 MFS transporter [Adlercreutzia sp. R25]
MLQPIENNVSPFRFWVLLANSLAYMAFAVAYQLTTALGSFVDLDFTSESYDTALLATACMLGFVIGPLGSGRINALLGPRCNVPLWLIILAVVSLLFIPCHESFPALLFIRVCQGICGGMMVASIVGSVNAWFPYGEAGIATGFTMGSMGLGFGLAQAIAVAFAGANLPWYTLTAYTTSVLALAVATVYGITVRDFESRYPGFSKINQIIARDISGQKTADVRRARHAEDYVVPVGIAGFLRTSMFWAMAGFGFIKSSLTCGLALVLPQFLAFETTASLSWGALTSGLAFVTTAAAAPLGGLLSRILFKGLRYPVMCFGAMISAVTLACVGFAHTLPLLLVLYILGYASTALGTGVYWSLSTEIVAPATAPRASALLTAIANMGGTFAPLLLAAIATVGHSYLPCFVILAVLSLIQFACAWYIAR